MPLREPVVLSRQLGCGQDHPDPPGSPWPDGRGQVRTASVCPTLKPNPRSGPPAPVSVGLRLPGEGSGRRGQLLLAVSLTLTRAGVRVRGSVGAMRRKERARVWAEWL